MVPTLFVLFAALLLQMQQATSCCHLQAWAGCGMTPRSLCDPSTYLVAHATASLLLLPAVMGGQWYDANISLPGCDKNMPGTIIAMARLNRPSIMIYGGTIRAGQSGLTGQPLDVVAAFQSYGECAA